MAIDDVIMTSHLSG